MPVDKVTIQQFAQKIKEKYPQYKDINDSILVDKIVNKHPEYKERINYQSDQAQQTEPQQPPQQSVQQPSFQVQLSNPTFKSVPSQTGTKQFDYSGTTSPKITKLQGLRGQAVEAADKLNKEIETNKGALGRVVVGDRLKKRQKDLEMSGGQMPINIKPEDELFINDDELNKVNEEAKTDVNRAHQVLSAAIQLQPEKKRDIAANLYAIDAFNSAANDPNGENRVKKIEENKKKLESGQLEYDYKKNILYEPQGFFGSLVAGRNELNRLSDAYDATKKMEENGNEAAIIKELNDRLKLSDPDEPAKLPSGILGDIGHGIGSMPVKGLIGGIVAGAGTSLLGNPEASPGAFHLASAAINANDMYKIGYQNALEQNYARFKAENPEMPDYDAFKKAQELASKQAVVDAASAAAMQYFGGKVGFGAAKQLQKGITGALSNIKDELGKKAFEAAGIGGIGAGTQAVKNLMAQQSGINVKTSEGVKEAFDSGVLITGAMSMLGLANEYLKPTVKNKLLAGLGKAPENVVEEGLNRLEQTGTLTPEQTTNVRDIIKEQRALEQLIPQDLPETDRLKVGAKIKERSLLKQKLEQVDEAYHPEIKEDIKKLNEEIIAISKGSERGELQSLVNKEIKKNNVQGVMAEVLTHSTEKELEGFMKDISEQATDPATTQATIETFGENIVNKAKELYPKSELDVKITEIEKGRTEELQASSDVKTNYQRVKDGSSAADIILPEPNTDKVASLHGGTEKIESLELSDDEFEKLKTANREQRQQLKKDIAQRRISELENAINEKHDKEIELLKAQSKENAIPERSTEASNVDESSRSSEEVVGGVSEPGEIAIPQEGQSESKSSSQEKVGDHNMIGITHAQMDNISRELGLETYQEAPETIAQWDAQAKERFAKDPEALNKLINKLRNGEGVDKVETRMMIMHMADLKARYDATPTPELLNEIKRTKDLYNISGREKGKELVARKGSVPTEETLSDFHLQDIDFNKGAPLTEEQTSISTREYNEIKAAKDALEEKVAKYEAEKIKQKAEKKIQEEAKAGKRDAKKDYKSEREEILKNIGDKWKKSSKENFGVSFVPYAKELAAIAPDVMKLVRNLVEEGVEKLPDVIKVVHDHIKNYIPHITEKDVHDIIAGEYTKKQPRSKISEQLYDLRKEAKLMNELDQLLKGEIPTDERKLRRRNQRIEELKNQIKELKDEMGLNERSMDEKLASLKGRYKTKIKELEDKLAAGDYGPDEKPESIELDKEGRELRDKYLELKDQRAIRLLEQEYANRSLSEKAGGVISKTLKTGRTLQSSFDVSYPFRQTIVGLSRELFALPFTKKNGKWEFNNFQAQKNLTGQFGKMYRSFGSEKVFRQVMDDIHTDPRYEMAQNAGLDFADPISNLDRAKEEMFQKSYAEDIPYVKKGVKASHRAATVIANKMKWDIFTELTDRFKEEGKTFENSKELYEATAKYANQLVGRGILGEKLEMAAPVIAHFVYSLRLYASRLQLLTYLVNPRFYTKVPKEIRIEYLKDMTKFVALGGTIMGLASAAGLGVGLNPLSSEFGSITVGDTKYDAWGGFKQYVVLLSRFLAGRTADKELRPLFTEEEGGRNEKSRGDLILRFLRTKASPELGAVVDISTGKDFMGNPVTVKSATKNYFTPLIYKDITDVLNSKDGSVVQAMLTFLLAAHGVGAQTYTKNIGGSGGGAGASGHYKSPSKTKSIKQTKTVKH